MTETKCNTPGPYWRNTTKAAHQVCGAHGKVIRSYPLTAFGDAASTEDVRRLQGGHVKADKRLRDAAPDLLAALIRAEQDLVQLLDVDGVDRSKNDATVIIVRAALSKAECDKRAEADKP